MVLDAATLAVTLSAVFITTFIKGAFGGGFAIIGIPLMALAMDPIIAGALLAPIFVLSDVFALRYWRPSTWSRVDLAILIPAQLAGSALGFAVMALVNRHVVAVLIALITLGFTALWFYGGSRIVQRPRSTAKGVTAGVCSGMASMLAHSGGPPVAMYLLPLGLPKSVYAGTTFMYFAVANFVKVWPWLFVAKPDQNFWTLLAIAAPVVPLAVWIGWRLHTRIDQTQMYRACYALLVLVALKMLWDGVTGLQHP